MRPSCTRSDRCSGLINAFGSVVAFAAMEEDLDQNCSYINDHYGCLTTHNVKKLCILDIVNIIVTHIVKSQQFM